MALDFANACKFVAGAGGLTDFTATTAAPGHMMPATANVVSGQSYRYRAESSDLSQWEIGTGLYTNVGGSILQRTSVLFSSTGSKINFTNAPTVGLTLFAEDLRSIRERLLTNRNYYVATTGSNSADGLTLGTPFLTIQKAIDIACALDLNIYYVVVNVADGTYNEGISTKYYVGGMGNGIILRGNLTTPANVVINNIGGWACFYHAFAQPWTIQGFTLTASGSNSGGIFAFNSAIVSFDHIVFGNCGAYHLWANSGGYFVNNGAITISGPASFHLLLQQSCMAEFRGAVYTFTTNPTNFNGTFIQAAFESTLLIGGCTFTNKAFATGKRFTSNQSSNIDTGSAGLTYLPGNIAGTCASNGTYDDNKLSPGFRAHKNGALQTVAVGTVTQLTFGTELYDVGNYFVTDAWTPPAGLVDINASAGFIKDPSAIIGTAVSATLGTAGTSTFMLTSVALPNGSTVYSVGIYSTVATTGSKIKIAQVVSTLSFNFVIDQSFNHGGGGWQDVVLTNPYTVPDTGAYSIGLFGNVAAMNQSTVATVRSGKPGDQGGVGNSAGWSSGSFVCYPMRYQLSGGGASIEIFKNGVSFARTSRQHETIGAPSLAVIAKDNASGTDVYTVYAKTSATTISGSAIDTSFSGHCS